MDFERLLNAIDRAEETAYGSDEKGELSRDRAKAIDYYLGKNTMPAPEGRSQVVDRSVFETINWILPSIVDIFANGDDVIALPPVGPEDVEGAKQEAQYLNHVLLNKNPWLEIIMTLAVDSFLTKNAYVYVYKEYKRTVEIEKYENQTKESLQLLLDDKDVKVIEESAKPDPDGAMEPVMGENGIPVITGVDPAGQPIPAMQPMMLYDVTIRRTETHGNYCIEVLPPERCKISEHTPTFRLKDCPYFEYWCDTTISNLRKMGFNVPDDISDVSEDTEEDLARDQYNETRDDEKSYDPALRRVKLRTIWIEFDTDEDGIAEMQRVLRVGRTILSREEVGRIHVASTVPIPLPHRHIGMSLADITGDLQAICTALMRGGLDNLYLSNNGRMGISNKVSIDDALLSRPGQPIRVDTDMPDVMGHIVPVQTPFIFPQAMEGMAFMNSVRERRTGINNSFQGLDASQLTQLQPGTVNQISSMAAQRVKLLARIFGCCIEDIASILHEVVLKSGHKKETVELRGQWVDVDPAAWKKRKDFKTVVGYAAGNKDAMISRLMMIANMQEKALMGGLPIVTPKNVHETATEIVKASDFASPERFFTDPAKIPDKGPPQPDVTVVAMEQLKAQSAAQVKQMDIEQKERDSQRDFELGKYQTDVDAQTKIQLALHQTQHAKEVEHYKGEQALGLEHTRAQLNPKTVEANAKKQEVQQSAAVIEKFMAAQEARDEATAALFKEVISSVRALSGPKRIVRDPKSGKAVGVEPVMQ